MLKEEIEKAWEEINQALEFVECDNAAEKWRMEPWIEPQLCEPDLMCTKCNAERAVTFLSIQLG